MEEHRAVYVGYERKKREQIFSENDKIAGKIITLLKGLSFWQAEEALKWTRERMMREFKMD